MRDMSCLKLRDKSFLAPSTVSFKNANFNVFGLVSPTKCIKLIFENRKLLPRNILRFRNVKNPENWKATIMMWSFEIMLSLFVLRRYDGLWSLRLLVVLNDAVHGIYAASTSRPSFSC